ncbi:hypothetical protein [Streptomyces nodosus]|uniref:hypothetical protein n=1 Tax=Streptomyces nodosus TaxID=40318 RepID=UPI003808757F
MNEFVNGHGMRQCCYRSEEKAHVQHVLTAIAVNLDASASTCRQHLPGSPGTQPPSRASSTGSTSPGRGPGALPLTPQAEPIVRKVVLTNLLRTLPEPI